MGLDFSNNDAHWSYGGFMNFRRKLAKEIEIDIDSMQGFVDGKGGISWDNVTDPLKIFLNHSDCDGELSPKECELIAPRLLEIIRTWDDSLDNQYDKSQAILLISGMNKSIINKEPLEFC